ncbi:hypothetical protein [Chitinophaga deserti]|uniref:hypothetical protein n=1 Tax=Chitinophaga deserti TaxID=2164099 RepID=UPI000D6D5A79|nr:hypothetical protein [Chitinophaga deserti]
MTKQLLITLTLFAGITTSAAAQSKPKPAARTAKPAAAATADKKLAFRTTWGIYLSDSLPRPEVLKILDSALVVRDNKNIKYPVISFDFLYEAKEAYLNDTTSQVAFYSETTGDSFKGDRLSPLWSKRLKETIQKGEALIFSNIIIQYSEDKFYRVPELRIAVR